MRNPRWLDQMSQTAGQPSIVRPEIMKHKKKSQMKTHGKMSETSLTQMCEARIHIDRCNDPLQRRESLKWVLRMHHDAARRNPPHDPRCAPSGQLAVSGDTSGGFGIERHHYFRRMPSHVVALVCSVTPLSAPRGGGRRDRAG